MDIFKLLARSTNVQKSTSTNRKPSSSHLPSAGSPKLPPERSELGFERSVESPVLRGTKRRRGGVLKGGRKEYVPETLNFFGGGNGQSEDDVATEKVILGREQNLAKDEEEGQINLDVDEAECRRVLKRNKVKVTVLKDPVPSPSNGVRDLENTEIGGLVLQNDKKVSAQILPQPLIAFHQLRSKYGISRRIAENLEAQGYREPTSVQLSGLPLLLGSDEARGLPYYGRKKSQKQSRTHVDLLTVAPTGSGKTLGFLIPVLQGLLMKRQAEHKTDQAGISKHPVQALIIAPTHELADQIVNEGRKLAAGTAIKVSGLRKGMRLHPGLLEVDGSAKGAHENDLSGETMRSNESLKTSLVKSNVVVSTPLLLLHAIQKESPTTLPLASIRYLVLDEADILLDPLFRPQTLAIWSSCTSPDLQISLWSATIGSSVETLAQNLINERRRNLGLPDDPTHAILRLVVGLRDSAVQNISHRLIYAATEQGKLLALRQLLHPSAAPTDSSAPPLQPPFLIFTQTISRAIALHSELLYDIPPEAGGSSRIAVLHSDLSDTARSNIMAGFRKGEIWVLITTDLLSRGVDFRGMNGVVNYDIPNTGASYVHRVGRTGRQGREGGVAVTLYTKEDIPYVKNVANVIAASERAKRQSGGKRVNGEGGREMGVQKWLLDALPDVSKKMRKELKRKGVESRRVGQEGVRGKERISTKSGYDRRVENKRKGAVERRPGMEVAEASDGIVDGNQGAEWGGFDD
ncbi:RNA-dependent ATPase rok1 [Puttea exsequens]|nr:RNA-dependent ATPase rok1 [Puttea exsequens]